MRTQKPRVATSALPTLRLLEEKVLVKHQQADPQRPHYLLLKIATLIAHSIPTEAAWPILELATQHRRSLVTDARARFGRCTPGYTEQNLNLADSFPL